MKREYSFTSFDGKILRVTEWAAENPVGLIQISHGMVEYAGRYDALAEYLAAKGYTVFADDHRGHGRTDEGTLGYAEGDMFADTLTDLAALSKDYRDRYPDLPLCLLGHSYGSFLAQAYLQRFSRFLSSAVLMGSAKLGRAETFAGRVVSSLGKPQSPCNFMKKMTFDAYNKKCEEGNFVTSLAEESEKYSKDPYCSFVCSNNFYRSFMRAGGKLYTGGAAEKLDKNLPLLIISGEDDPVGKYGKSTRKLYEWYRDAGVRDVTLKLLPGSRHECLNDVGREETYAALLAFFARTLGKKTD